MKTRYVQKIIDGNSIEFTCEPINGEYLDTRVQLNGILLCWIPFDKLDDFVSGYLNWLNKYSIYPIN